ncbi:hypothetical protein HAV15_005600 [Penicillium sp. str. |nr:hypothetical protein HAV15_005600 [Penicillium sp. str. \
MRNISAEAFAPLAAASAKAVSPRLLRQFASAPVVDQKLCNLYIAQLDCQGKRGFLRVFSPVLLYIGTMLDKEFGNSNMAVVNGLEYRPVVPRLIVRIDPFCGKPLLQNTVHNIIPPIANSYIQNLSSCFVISLVYHVLKIDDGSKNSSKGNPLLPPNTSPMFISDY